MDKPDQPVSAEKLRVRCQAVLACANALTSAVLFFPHAQFFGRPTFLTVSGQLYAEMLACSLSRVYTFGPTFRAEQSQTVRHLNEFWMIEPEVTHMDLKQVMDLAERFVKSTVRYILQHCETDLRFLQSRLSNPTLLSTLQATSAEDFTFARVTFSEALEILHKSKKKFQFLPSWENGLQSEHEKYLSDVHFRRPVFISHYPRASKPFYMRTTPPAAKEGVDATKETASCFDLIIPGVGELIGGSEREERYDELVKNMQQHKIDPKLYQWYLDLRTYGTVPHA
jgi:asparaginyl-tRNA synthetase